MKVKYKPIPMDELLSLSRGAFVERCKAWIEEFNDGELMDVQDPLKCPVHIWVVHNKAACSKEAVANTMVCPICGNPCCPDCMNHLVEQISRITGYMGTVSGWNAAKKQEFKDRTRHNI